MNQFRRNFSFFSSSLLLTDFYHCGCSLLELPKATPISSGRLRDDELRELFISREIEINFCSISGPLKMRRSSRPPTPPALAQSSPHWKLTSWLRYPDSRALFVYFFHFFAKSFFSDGFLSQIVSDRTPFAGELARLAYEAIDRSSTNFLSKRVIRELISCILLKSDECCFTISAAAVGTSVKYAEKCICRYQ